MPSSAICPKCGPRGNVTVVGRGDASCAVCLGSFAPMATVIDALAAASIGPELLREIVAREGTRKLPCPGCGGLLTSFTALRERLHACSPCAAVWSDANALARLAPHRASTAPIVASASAPSTGVVVGQDAATAPLPAAPPVGDGATFGGVTIGPRSAPVEEEPFQPAVAAFAESDGTMFKAALFAGFALMVAAGFYLMISSAFSDGKPVDIGGGAQVLFWDNPIERTSVNSPVGSLSVLKSPSKAHVLLTAYVAGAGGEPARIARNGNPDAALSALFGRWCRLTSQPSQRQNGFWALEGDCVVEEGNINHVAMVTVYFNDKDLWIVAAKGDSAMFARSAKALSFRESFSKIAKK